jgi:uncharacterized protein YlxW (UPF0749 family)
MNNFGIVKPALPAPMSGAAIKRYLAPAGLAVALTLGFNGSASAQAATQQQVQQLQAQVQQLQKEVATLMNEAKMHVEQTKLHAAKAAAVKALIANGKTSDPLTKAIGDAL